MMDGPMTITMDLHQQILAASRDTALQEAAGVALANDSESFNDTYKTSYNRKRYDVLTCERMKNNALDVQAEDARSAILSLRATPAPVSPAVRIAELEAALKSLCNEVHSLEVFEHDIRCGIGNTNFACIQNALVNARAALSTQESTDAG
jgi:hypothetical protein